MKNLIKDILQTRLITILEQIWVIACEMSYALVVIVAILLIPFALMLRAIVEIRAALRHGQMTHSYPKPVYH